jgi:hypothetical protein
MRTFRIEERTWAVLRNFSRINDAVCLQRNGKIRVQDGNIMAASTVQPFERDFVLTTVHDFLVALSGFKEPRLRFDGNVLRMSEGNALIADPFPPIEFPEPDHIELWRIRETTLPPVDAIFTLPRWALNAITTIWRDRDVAVIGSNGTIIAKNAAYDDRHGGAEVPLGNADKDFCLVLKAGYFKMFLADEYRVEISVPFKASAGRGHKAFPKTAPCRFVGRFIEYVIPGPARLRSVTGMPT